MVVQTQDVARRWYIDFSIAILIAFVFSAFFLYNSNKLLVLGNFYFALLNIVIATLKDKPEGSFIIRDSNTFPGSYGLAVKVDKVPVHIKSKPSKIIAF